MYPEVPKERVLLSPKEVHYLTGISIPQLEVWRREVGGPKFCRIGRLVKYWRDDLIAFAKAREAA